tara:strand:+ start:4182 stop:4394 length:213 start_codon:yes stop_codon:yes gene_type:complete
MIDTDKLQNNNTKVVAKRLVEEIHFLKHIAHQINTKLKGQEQFLNILYDRMLEAGMKDYDVAWVLGRDEE